MVTNAPAEFYAAKRKFEEAKTPEEKLKALEEMLKYAPKHKGSENLLAWIKKEISKYKKENKKGNKSGIKLIEKNGDLLISIISIFNNLEIDFLKRLSNDINTNKSIIITRTIFYNGVYYQFVNIPSLDSIYKNILSISDYLIVILDRNYDINEQIEALKQYVDNLFNIDYNSIDTKILYNDEINKIDIKNLLEDIINNLNLIRIFPINSNHCVLLSKSSKVKDFIENINENWLEKFIYANIIRNNKKIRAGLNYELKDLDIIELKLKI